MCNLREQIKSGQFPAGLIKPAVKQLAAVLLLVAVSASVYSAGETPLGPALADA